MTIPISNPADAMHPLSLAVASRLSGFRSFYRSLVAGAIQTVARDTDVVALALLACGWHLGAQELEDARQAAIGLGLLRAEGRTR